MQARARHRRLRQDPSRLRRDTDEMPFADYTVTATQSRECRTLVRISVSSAPATAPPAPAARSPRIALPASSLRPSPDFAPTPVTARSRHLQAALNGMASELG